MWLPQEGAASGSVAMQHKYGQGQTSIPRERMKKLILVLKQFVLQNHFVIISSEMTWCEEIMEWDNFISTMSRNFSTFYSKMEDPDKEAKMKKSNHSLSIQV